MSEADASEGRGRLWLTAGSALLVVSLAGAFAGADPSGASSLADADALNQRVEQLYGQGLYPEALSLAERVLRIREAALGPNAAEVAASLNRLAVVYRAMGQLERALPLIERALHIRETVLGPDHPDIATSLNNLAVVYRAMGQYERALPLNERALRIWEAALGPNHPNVATSLNNLAEVYKALDRYDRALPLYERALHIWEAALGPNHPDVATGLNNLAEIYSAMGQFDRALPLHERALRISEAALGPNHPDVAARLNSLADGYGAMGQFDRALSLNERALRIRETALGPNHPDVATSLHSLAMLYNSLGRYDRALPLNERALHIWEAALGPNHPEVASSLTNLAEMYRALGRYDRALPLYERALHIWEATLGPNHPDVGASLYNLAALYHAMGRYERVVPLLERAQHIFARSIQGIASHQRENGVRQFLADRRGRADVLVSLAAERRDDLNARRLALQATLLAKARDEEESAATLAVLRASTTPQDQAALARWQSVSLQLAALHGDPVTERPQRERLEIEVAQAEEALARGSSAVRERRRLVEIDTLIPSVARQLPRDAALIELVAFRPFHPTARTPADRWAASHYAAFVLYPDGQHAMVDLGEAAPIDTAAHALFEAAAHPGADGDLAPVTHAGQALERLLFAPVRALLRPDVHRLVLAPDGPLHLAPLHLMHDGQRFLVDRYTLSYVTSGRDLLRERETPPQSTPPTMVAVTHYPVANWDRDGLRMQAAAMPALVPGMRLLTGEHATERELRALQAPTLLHIAAHGVFESDVGGDDPQRGAMQRGRLLMADVRPDLSTPAQGDDGQVTASEVLAMNLRGTRLVVLSACETGQGNATVGQGVFGLRRAFLLAGAEALVTALWNVDDELSVRFMEALYRGLHAGRRSADALAEAVAAVRRVDPHPYAWAPFVLVGRDDVIDLGPAPSAGRLP